jgi:hypothetical protein
VANHNQFVTPKSVITGFLPTAWTGWLMGKMNELDNAVDAGGYLRLSTIERTTKHMGNTIGDAMAAEAAALGIRLTGQPRPTTGAPGRGFMARLLRIRPLRRLLQGVYNRLFWHLSQQSGTWRDET